jgi:hypothetical protein
MNTSLQNMLSELEDARNLLSKHTNLSDIPNIERDLILSKLRVVYDKLIFENTNPTSKEIISKHHSDKSKTLVKQQEVLTSNEGENTLKENEPTITEPIINEDILTIEEDKNSEKLHETVKDVSKETSKLSTSSERTEKVIIAEKYHKNQTYINELLAQGLQKKDISSLMQAKAVNDIEAAIGVNERFVFIKELFSGDSESYLKTIRILNNAANFNEAFNYIHQTYSWNLDGETAQKLLDIVRRRFIVDVE